MQMHTANAHEYLARVWSAIKSVRNTAAAGRGLRDDGIKFKTNNIITTQKIK